jgi:hypothetical protein
MLGCDFALDLIGKTLNETRADIYPFDADVFRTPGTVTGDGEDEALVETGV